MSSGASATAGGAEPKVGSILDERYRLTELLRDGRTARSFLAERLADGRALIVKVVAIADPSDEEMARLRREAAVGAILSHPRIATPIAVLRTQAGAPFLVYERPPGEELGAVQKRLGKLPLEAVRRIVAQLADAVHAAHSEGVVHGDLRPATVLVEGEGGAAEALVIDYGIARLREARRPGASASSIASPALIGMAAYMAPEQAHGQKAEAPSDQFALAAMSYEMLTGVGPFGGGPTVAVLSRVLHADPPPMAGVSGAIERVVLRGLAKRPADRFPSTKDFGDAFEEAVAAGAAVRGVSRSAPTVALAAIRKSPEQYIETQVVALPPREAEDEIPRNRPLALWVAMGVAAVLGALGIGIVVGRRGAPPEALPVAVAPVEKPTPEQVTVRIELDVEPAGARVRIDDRQVTPPVVRLARGDVAHRMVVDADGYLPAMREIIPSEDQVVVVHLTTANAPSAARPRPNSRKVNAPSVPASTAVATPKTSDLRDPFN